MVGVTSLFGKTCRDDGPPAANHHKTVIERDGADVFQSSNIKEITKDLFVAKLAGSVVIMTNTAATKLDAKQVKELRRTLGELMPEAAQ